VPGITVFFLFLRRPRRVFFSPPQVGFFLHPPPHVTKQPAFCLFLVKPPPTEFFFWLSLLLTSLTPLSTILHTGGGLGYPRIQSRASSLLSLQSDNPLQGSSCNCSSPSLFSFFPFYWLRFIPKRKYFPFHRILLPTSPHHVAPRRFMRDPFPFPEISFNKWRSVLRNLHRFYFACEAGGRPPLLPAVLPYFLGPIPPLASPSTALAGQGSLSR